MSDTLHDKILAHFREQAMFCEAYGSPFTAQLIARMADDFVAGGPVAALVADWPANPRADALALRFTGALHFAALTASDPALAAQYPAARPDWRMDDLWPIAAAFLERERPYTEEFIRSAPQTNETRRAIALLMGFLDAARQAPGLPIETLELGASAGLNLNWDRFAYRTQSWRWGASDAAPGAVVIDTDWQGPPPALDARLNIRARAACDLNPLDITDPRARLQLKSYFWADQPERMARFDAAVALAQQTGVKVERADAAVWLKQKLAARAPDALTIVYHSIFFQYPPRETRDAITALIEAEGARATRAAPFAWVRLEPEPILGGPRESLDMLIDITFWPGGERRILGRTDGHVRATRSVG